MKTFAIKGVPYRQGTKNKVHRNRTLLFIALAVSANAANAYTVDIPGNFDMTTMASIEAIYDDNVFLTRQNAQADWITRVSPSVQLERQGAATSIIGDLTMTHGIYKTGMRKNFNDYTAKLNWNWKLASLVEVGISTGYSDLTQSVWGSNDGELSPILIESERTRRPKVEMAVRLGREGGKLQGRISHGRGKNEFQDPSREFSSTYSLAAADYSLSDRLMVGFQVTDRELDYAHVETISNRDSTESVILATGVYKLPKTEIQLRAGKLNREFADDGREDFEGSRWDFMASWSPKSYSTLAITTGRNVQESIGIADFIDVKSNEFSWSHKWAANWGSVFSYSQTTGKFVGVERSDEVLRSSIAIQYQPVHWIRFSFGADNLENQSSETDTDIERNRYFLGVEAPL